MPWKDNDDDDGDEKRGEDTEQPEGLPDEGPENREWEGGLSTEPSLASHFQNAGQTEADEHTTKPKG